MDAPQSPVFDADVVRSLEALGAQPSDPALDALADPRGAAERLQALCASAVAGGASAVDPIVLRVAHEHAAQEPGYGPDPIDPAWARIGWGSREPGPAVLQLSVAGRSWSERAEHIEIELAGTACCGAATCNQNKSKASAWISLEQGRRSGKTRLLFAEAIDVSIDKAREKVERIAARLAQGMGLALLVQGQTIAAESLSAPALNVFAEHGPAPLPAACIARHALRTEADRVVLRDHASRGPRNSAWRSAAIGFVQLALALGLWTWTVVVAREGRAAVALGIGAAAMLISLAATAFLGVARFAARYGAHSNPLVWIGCDRVVVAPWVNRRGGIDLRPEGRLGAAIRLGEVRAVSVVMRDQRPVVEIDSDHGRIDVVSTDREDVADFWCRALRRSIDEARHVTTPGAGGT